MKQAYENIKNIQPALEIFDTSFEEMIDMQVETLKYQAKVYNTIFNCHEKKQIKNCNFKQGDIMNLSEMYSPDSVDILLYRNALYHTLCEGNSLYRIMREDSTENMNKIASQMNKVVKMNGLLVFGENEFLQGIDTNKVADVMRENGFEPVINPKTDSQNMWKKVQNINV